MVYGQHTKLLIKTIYESRFIRLFYYDVIIPSNDNNITNDQDIIKLINNTSTSVLFFTIFDDNPYQSYVFLEAYNK